MRLDKFLKVTRLIKRRGVAKDLCVAGLVKVNGKVAKPMHEVNVGDSLELTIGRRIIVAKVKDIKEYCKKEEIENLYEIVSTTTLSEGGVQDEND